ncbi:hypothetical protein GCM10009838_07390 [Catenulispora subtropica]|uniref:Uncharacterized protein n=1 Tax=Catenulispora subtropica TaxID=450798 RepID=A0ABN2QL52_9ACTN
MPCTHVCEGIGDVGFVFCGHNRANPATAAAATGSRNTVISVRSRGDAGVAGPCP